MTQFRSSHTPRGKLKDPEYALKFLRAVGRVWTIWPIDVNSCKIKKIYHEFTSWFIIINLFVVIITLGISVCGSRKYPIAMAKNLSQLMIIGDTFSHLLLYRINRSDLRMLLQEVFEYLKMCRHQERLIMRKHYSRFLGHYITLIIMYAMAALAFSCGAFILRKKFPIDAMYPFSTDSVVVSTVVYVHQTLSIIQNSVIIMIDLLVITLFWYAGARIKILSYRLKFLTDDEQLKQCILEHQDIIRYVQYTVNTVRYILFKTVTIVEIIAISAGLQLIYYDAKTMISQFSLIIIVANLRIITYAATIDEMKHLNDNLRWIIYKSIWFQSSLKTKRSLLIFVHRCEMPLVTMNGRLLNIMTLKFFAKFIYATISHLITLRAIIERFR